MSRPDPSIVADRFLREAGATFLVPDRLIQAWLRLGKEMAKHDPDLTVRVGGWDRGNFIQPARRLPKYNSRRGGISYTGATGITVDVIATMFDEQADPRFTGWSLVQQINDPTVTRLWKAAKKEVDEFVTQARRTKTASRPKTAGEVRFIKDRGGDHNEWGWGTPGPNEREIDPGFDFKPKHLKPLATTLRAGLMALGHASSAYNTFTKVKSRNVSPDGSLGGKGYIAKIPEMRRQFMNAIEALSAITDTLYDEIQAPHWDNDTFGGGNRERQQVEQIMDDAEEIKDDPEGWAEEEESDMDSEHKKTASNSMMASNVADQYLAWSKA